jgi:hypothetical protein
MIIEFTKIRGGFIASSKIDGENVSFVAWGVGSKREAELLLKQYGEHTAVLQKIVKPLYDDGFSLYKTLPREKKNIARFAMICLGQRDFMQCN